jgi:hypothetical protein
LSLQLDVFPPLAPLPGRPLTRQLFWNDGLHRYLTDLHSIRNEGHVPGAYSRLCAPPLQLVLNLRTGPVFWTASPSAASVTSQPSSPIRILTAIYTHFKILNCAFIHRLSNWVYSQNWAPFLDSFFYGRFCEITAFIASCHTDPFLVFNHSNVPVSAVGSTPRTGPPSWTASSWAASVGSRPLSPGWPSSRQSPC